MEEVQTMEEAKRLRRWKKLSDSDDGPDDGRKVQTMGEAERDETRWKKLSDSDAKGQQKYDSCRI